MRKRIKKNSTTLSVILIALVVLISCQKKSSPKESEIISGEWLMELQLNEALLPVNVSIKKTFNSYKLIFINGQERILAEDLEVQNDSLFIKMPVFDSEFILAIKDSSSMEGYWLNRYKSDDYKIPVKFNYNKLERFKNATIQTEKSLGNKYQVVFSPGAEDPSPAIGIFEEVEGKIYGTFATETGDYRHLEGIVRNDSLLLSTFDGSHAFLFKAKIYEDSLVGIFYSGIHWKENWVAVLNPEAKLRDPDSLTFIKPGFEKVDFLLPNLKGDSISLSDKRFENKVIILQIMGSWCPNCLDETRYLSDLFNTYNQDGLEVVALAFERSRSKEKALNNLKRLQEKTKITYPILLGGSTREENAEEILPMLNHIMSYPTAIFIDKKGEVRKIHTGFYGPGTGEYYLNFTQETNAFIQGLLKE